jgi:hypothetical protein
LTTPGDWIDFFRFVSESVMHWLVSQEMMENLRPWSRRRISIERTQREPTRVAAQHLSLLSYFFMLVVGQDFQF